MVVAIFCIASLVCAEVDYLRDVKPLLRSRCGACHGALKQQASLRVDTAALAQKGGDTGPAIVKGNPSESLLLKRITASEAPERMPPEGPALSATQIDLLKRWISAGAKAPTDEKPESEPANHWAFQPPVRPIVPANKSPHPIDAFLKDRWHHMGLTPAGTANKPTLLRRVTLDLIGLPPTPEELQAYMADSSNEAFSKVVERLLASPHYGERWARHWMDVWRYSDWYGRRTVPDNLNSYGMIWRWRDWIVQSLNTDKPYSRMVQEMLAADELAPGDDLAAPATGFLVRNYFRWNYNQWMRDNVEHTSKAFLGLTMNCCQCHDHKYDPVSQEEYFRFRAIFEPLEIQQVRVPGEPDPGLYPKYSFPPGNALKPLATGMVRVFDEKPDATTRMYANGDERAFMADRVPVGPGVPGAFGNIDFKIKAITLPREVVYPGLKPFIRDEERVICASALKAAEQALLDEKTLGGRASREADVVAARSARAALEARIAADDAKWSGKTSELKVLARKAALAEKQLALALAESVRAKAMTKLTSLREAAAQGDAKAKAELPILEKAASTVETDKARAALATAGENYTPLAPEFNPISSGRRLALAQWIIARRNPLAARVAVNHVWNWHFGKPLVPSTENFGRNGQKPTHPELLDWLAVEFMDSNWSMKQLHRLIVNSDAYAMTSVHPRPEPNIQKDRDNSQYWVFPTQRLDAEAVRDSLLAASGELDRAMGGKEIPSDKGMTIPRRSLYFSHHPEERMVFLEQFDAANPCDCYRRSASVMPQQSLALANSPLAVQSSKRVAECLPHGDDSEFIKAAFLRILTRHPLPAEEDASRRFLTSQAELFRLTPPDSKPNGLSTDPARRAREHLALALFNHGDFVTVR